MCEGLNSHFGLDLVSVEAGCVMDLVVVGSPLDVYLNSLLEEDEEGGEERREVKKRILGDFERVSFNFEEGEEEEEKGVGKRREEGGLEEMFEILWESFLEISENSEKIFGILTSTSPPPSKGFLRIFVQ